MALKLQNMEIMTSLTPTWPKNTKKGFFKTSLPLWPLKWPWWPLLAFYIFSAFLDALKGHWYQRMKFFINISSPKEIRWNSHFNSLCNQGGQDLKLDSSCIYFGTIVHEFIHAWGFHHEHTRPDRDKYVKVYRENIIDELWYNFKKQEQSCTFGVPYDGNSIMHYHSRAGIKPNLWIFGKLTIESLVNFYYKVSFI